MQNERIDCKFLKFKKSIKLEKMSKILRKVEKDLHFLHISKGTEFLLQTLIF